MKQTYSLLASALLVLIAGTAVACPAHSTKSAAVLTPSASRAALVAWKPRAWTPPVQRAAARQGLVVSIDPVDGAMGMPAPGELESNLVIDSDAPVETLHRADGSMRATLDERFAEFAVVTLGANGKPAWTCVHGVQGATQFMKKPAVPALTPNRAPAPGTVWEEK